MHYVVDSCFSEWEYQYKVVINLYLRKEREKQVQDSKKKSRVKLVDYVQAQEHKTEEDGQPTIPTSIEEIFGPITGTCRHCYI